MIYIIRRLLIEMDYKPGEGFRVDYELESEAEDKFLDVHPFISIKEEGSCILVCLISEGDFLEFYDKNLVVAIASSFRKCSTYTPEMDKNTSLILAVQKNKNASLSIEKQRRIEDDPYYFKKYVLLYSKNELSELKGYVKDGQNILELIKHYIYNKENFNKYKEHPDNNQLYSIITNLSTKIPIIPMDFSNSNELFDVNKHFEEKFEAKHTKKQREGVEELIKLVSQFPEDDLQSIDKLIAFSSSLKSVLSEGEIN